MPNFTQLPILDVAIGLSFMFFLLSLVCSSVAEMVAQVLGLRGRMLAQALDELIGDASKSELYEKIRKLALQRAKPWWVHTKLIVKDAENRAPIRRAIGRFWRNSNLPSYLSKDSFARATTAVLAEDAVHSEADSVTAAVHETFGEESLVADIWREAVHESDPLNAFKVRLGDQFDESMDRVAGWYKRQNQWILLLIALALACAMNVDTIHVADRLFKDDSLRTAVVAKAIAEIPQPTGAAGATDLTGQYETIAKQIDRVQYMGLPIGWVKANMPQNKNKSTLKQAAAWSTKALGILITAFALSLGAPFWFDALGRVANLRGTGKRIETATDKD